MVAAQRPRQPRLKDTVPKLNPPDEEEMDGVKAEEVEGILSTLTVMVLSSIEFMMNSFQKAKIYSFFSRHRISF